MLVSNLTIEDLFSGDEKFSFLIGAGCSIDKHSCLAAGREMMNEKNYSKALEIYERSWMNSNAFFINS